MTALETVLAVAVLVLAVVVLAGGSSVMRVPARSVAPRRRARPARRRRAFLAEKDRQSSAGDLRPRRRSRPSGGKARAAAAAARRGGRRQGRGERRPGRGPADARRGPRRGRHHPGARPPAGRARRRAGPGGGPAQRRARGRAARPPPPRSRPPTPSAASSGSTSGSGCSPRRPSGWPSGTAGSPPPSADLADREAALAAPRGGAGRRPRSSRRELERIAGLTADAARAELIETIESQAKREAALLVRDIENDARHTAEHPGPAHRGRRDPAGRQRADRGERGQRAAPAQRRDEGPDHRPRGPQHPGVRVGHRGQPDHRRHARRRCCCPASTRYAARSAG